MCFLYFFGLSFFFWPARGRGGGRDCRWRGLARICWLSLPFSLLSSTSSPICPDQALGKPRSPFVQCPTFLIHQPFSPQIRCSNYRAPFFLPVNFFLHEGLDHSWGLFLLLYRICQSSGIPFHLSVEVLASISPQSQKGWNHNSASELCPGSLSPLFVPLRLNQLIKLEIYWRKQMKVPGWGSCGLQTSRSPVSVLVYISLNILIPGQQRRAKNVDLKGIEFNAAQVPFLKGSAAPLVVEFCLAE